MGPGSASFNRRRRPVRRRNVNVRRKAGPAQKAVAELTGKGLDAACVQVDVSKLESVQAAAKTVATFGKVHVISNNAGVAVGRLQRILWPARTDG